MADDNPWASDDTSRNTGLGSQNSHPYANSNNPYAQRQRDPSPNYQQQTPYRDDPHQPQQNQYQSYSSEVTQGNQPSYQAYNAPSGPPPSQSFGQPYDEPYAQQPTYNAWEGASGNPPLPARHPARNAAPSQNIRRSDTDDLLDQQEDRAEQVEHLQAYEATANASADDRNRAQLEKEFPDIDGSLIAALYGDTKDLSATREMLQEIGRQ